MIASELHSPSMSHLFFSAERSYEFQCLDMMRTGWNCSKISILAIIAASELHSPIPPNVHVDAIHVDASDVMRGGCSKISIITAPASELHSSIPPNFHVDATSFHVLMHLM